MSVAIQSLPSSSRDAAGLAARLGVPFHEIAIHGFPDGEIRVTAGPASATTIIYASLDRPNDKLIALMFAAEALRRGGAKRLVLVAPYLCYMRQDTAFHEGEAISQKVIGPLLARCIDRVVTVDAHLHRTPDIRAVFPGIQSDNLSAMPAISDALRKAGLDPATVVVGTGCGIAALGQRPRRPARPVLYRCEKDPARRSLGRDRVSGRACIAGRPVLIVDDIVSSGGTIIACAKALTAAGATAIDAVVTHALFPEAACSEMIASGIRSIRSTHSVPHFTNAIVLDELFADALKGELSGGISMSVTIRFCGASRTVTGSCYLFETGAGRFLVDCGLFQGQKTLKELNYRAFPFRPADIDAVLLTHAHIDHSGLLPKLVRGGFAGRILATRGTIDLCSYMLPDAGSIQESEVLALNRRNAARGRGEVSPIYTQADAIAALQSFAPVDYEKWIDVIPGVRARYWNAGHLLGSASIEIECADGASSGKPMRILASGDIGPDAKLLQPDPDAPAGFDYVIAESTYGDRERPATTPDARRARLAEEVRDAATPQGRAADPSLCGRAHPGASRRPGRPDGTRRNSCRADLSGFSAGDPRHRGVSQARRKPRSRRSTFAGC